MDSFDTFSDSDSESDIADLTRGMQSTPPLPWADADSGIHKIMCALEENMRTKCQLVVCQESTHYSPYDMPKLEVADCIKPLLGNPTIPSYFPGVRMVLPPVPRAVRFQKRNDPSGSMSKYSDSIRYIPDTMNFALQAYLHEMAVPDFGAPSSGEDTDFADLDLNMDTEPFVTTLSSKDLISELLRGGEKPKHNRDQVENLLAGPSQLQSVPRSMQKPLNQPGRKKKNRRNRPMQPQIPPQPTQPHSASEPAVSDNLASTQHQKRALKKEQKKVQKQQRKRKNRR